MNYESAGLPEHLDVTSIESAEQSLLRDAFASLTVFNADTIRNFQPAGGIAEAVIELDTSLERIEASEPLLTQTYRQTMLQELGLADALSEDDDAAFWRLYSDGTVVKIDRLPRDDGTSVYFEAICHDDDTELPQPDELHLMSNEHAEAEIARRNEAIEEVSVDARLIRDIGIDPGLLNELDMSLAEKRLMLAAYDEINNKLEVRLPDLTSLNRQRRRVVKDMLPVFDVLDERRQAHAERRREAYVWSLNQLVNSTGADERTAAQIFARERLLRLADLDRQLRIRKRASRLGAIAIGSGVTLGGALIGASFGAAALENSLPIEFSAMPLAVSGAVLGIGMTARKFSGFFSRIRSIEGFQDMRERRALDDELNDEASRASEFFLKTMRI